MNPYGLTRWILSAKMENLQVLDIRSDFPKSSETEGFSSFHRVQSVLSVSIAFGSFYHKFITAESMQEACHVPFTVRLSIVCKHTCCGFGKEFSGVKC